MSHLFMYPQEKHIYSGAVKFHHVRAKAVQRGCATRKEVAIISLTKGRHNTYEEFYCLDYYESFD